MMVIDNAAGVALASAGSVPNIGCAHSRTDVNHMLSKPHSTYGHR